MASGAQSVQAPGDSAEPATPETNPTGPAGWLRGLIARRTGNWSLEGDPQFMNRLQPVWNLLMDRYFRMEVSGWDRLPDPPALLVGNHASGVLPVEAYAICYAWYRHFGPDRILHGTSHDLTFAFPLLGAFMRKAAALPASRESITAALAAGHDVIVWPGGDRDALRPWAKRDKVVLAGRHGFVKQAIQSKVPIVPVPTVGGSDTLLILTEGRGLPSKLRLNQLLRTDVFPLALGLPFGVAPAMIPQLPLPAKIRTEFLDPIEVGTDPVLTDDSDYLHAKYLEVARVLQAGVDRLAARRRFPVFG